MEYELAAPAFSLSLCLAEPAYSTHTHRWPAASAAALIISLSGQLTPRSRTTPEAEYLR